MVALGAGCCCGEVEGYDSRLPVAAPSGQKHLLLAGCGFISPPELSMVWQLPTLKGDGHAHAMQSYRFQSVLHFSCIHCLSLCLKTEAICLYIQVLS